MRKVIIGITAGYEAEEDLVNYHRSTLCIDYTKSVIKAGAVPIVLPLTEDEEVIETQLELIDALILSGGHDIQPTLYGEDYKEGIGEVAPERDAYEWKVLEKFLETGKPILGICRGMQLLNVFFGGTLYQDLKYYPSWHLDHNQKTYPDLVTQKLYLEEGEDFLRRIFPGEPGINSFHHQAVKDIGEGLKVLGRTSDGVIEAIQKEDHPFCYGLQWHPEMMTARGNKEMLEIFKAFVGAAK